LILKLLENLLSSYTNITTVNEIAYE
jgi:hypothetical protein